MKIDSIRVKNVDTRVKPVRTAEIRIGPETITTPTRAANLYEYNSKAKIPSDLLIGNKISLKYTSLSYGQLSRLLTDTKEFESLHNALDNTRYRVQHSPLNIAVYQPTITRDRKRNIPSAMEILENDNNLVKFVDLITALQISAGYDVIAIPSILRPFEKLKEIYRKKADEIYKIGKEPFFIIDLKYNHANFQELLKFLTDDLQARLVGLNYKRFASAALNYRELSNYHDKDTIFFTIQVARADLAFNSISVSHYIPFLINDISCVAAPPRVFDSGETIGNNSKNKLELSYPEKLMKLKLFNSEDLLLEPFGNRVNAGKILQDLDRSDDSRLRGILDNYSNSGDSAKETDKRYEILNAFTRVHELKCSTKEFDNFSNFIKTNDIRNYISTHSVLDRTVSLLDYPTS
ncbi:hypothetical protein [Candidatus Nitrosocosmicus sp. T]